MGLAIKFTKQACGEPPRGVDVQITGEDHELGSYRVGLAQMATAYWVSRLVDLAAQLKLADPARSRRTLGGF